MRGKILPILGAVLLTANTAWASPLLDCSPGRVAVDYAWYAHQVALGERDADHTPYDWGITAGLGGNTAVQYRQAKFDTDANPTRYYMRSREINLIHRFDQRVAVFAGLTRVNGRSDGGRINDHDAVQFGLIGDRQLSDRFHLYGILSNSKHNEYANVEFGLSYALTPQTEVNLIYRHLSADHIPPAEASSNLRGFGLGMTYKF